LLDGIRICVTEPGAFRPVFTALTLLHCLQALHGPDRIWRGPGTRPEWFDKLFGTASVRQALMDSESPRRIAARWRRETAPFAAAREQALLYRNT
jgi:uncharacterized protein YbbC (DUF1343 family)